MDLDLPAIGEARRGAARDHPPGAPCGENDVIPAAAFGRPAGRAATIETRSQQRGPHAATSGAQSCGPLLLAGSASPPTTRRIVALLAQALPCAREQVIAGASHMLPLSHRDGANTAIIGHLDRHAGRLPTAA